jgi:hypothetical protein
MNQTIRGETFEVDADVAEATVALRGTMRLNGMDEYAGVTALLREACKHEKPMVIDLRELEFLNSSGIAMLSKFVIEARNGGTALTIRGARRIAWQGKSLVNLQRLMPALVLDIA